MILVVDDDKNIRLSLKLILERNEYEVALAEGPKEAMQIVRNIPAVELVLMDMNYTRATDGEEGLTLLKQVKVFRPDLPVILMTAWGSIDLAVQGMRAGAFDFITKPWDNGVLLDRIETARSLTPNPSPRGEGSSYSCCLILFLSVFTPLVPWRGGRGKASCRLYPVKQHTIVPRLGDEVEGAGTHALHGQIDAAPGRHQDTRHLRAEHLYLLQQRQSFLAVSSPCVIHIHQHQLYGGCITDNLYGLLRSFSQGYLIPVALQNEFQG